MSRGGNNKKEIPDREFLIDLYHNKNMNILNISKMLGNVSNVTVRKWFKYHNIPIKSHRETIKQTHIDRQYSSFKLESTQNRVKETFIKKYGVPYHPNNNKSKAEIEILNFFNNELQCNMKKSRFLGFELDGYDEKIKAGFEYCGHYWHNENSPTPKNKTYHYDKYMKCKNSNIRLFTIFEYEWNERKEQVKNYIRGALNNNKIRIYARLCQIEVYNTRNSEVDMFLDKHHIQGKPKSYFQANVLRYENDIVGVMTFSKHHRNIKDCVVLSRLCWKSNTSVVGGAKRLLSHYNIEHELISWSDNRWSIGSVYERLGFKLDAEYKSDYIYVSGKKWKSKQSMQKKKIGARYNQKEHERAYELGWNRMWDCGKKKWIIKDTSI